MRLALLYTILFWGTALQAQYRFNNYKKLTIEDGLPSNYVFDIAEDSQGFIWLATANGLVRYDGSKFTKVEKIAADSMHLLSDYIVSLLVRGDSLWVGTKDGLSILNRTSGQISNHVLDRDHFKKDYGAGEIERRYFISDVVEDRQKNVWLAPAFGGFVKWDRQKKEFIHYPVFPDESLPSNYLQMDQTSLVALLQDTQQDSIFWGASRAGLLKLNTDTKEISRILFNDISDHYRFQINRKICMYQSPDNRMIYSGSWQGGLSVYDPLSGNYTLPALTHAKDLERAHNLKLNQLHKIVPGEKGKLLLSYGNGLFSYQPEEKTFLLIKKNLYKKTNIGYGIDFIDSQNRLWNVASNGVYFSDPVENQFEYFSLEDMNTSDFTLLTRSIVEDFYPGYVSITGQFGDGVYHVNPTTGHRFKTRAEEHLKNNRSFSAMGMTRLNDEILLVAEGHQLYKLYKKDNTLVPYLSLPLKNNYQKFITLDEKGVLWVTTMSDGLFSVDVATNKITHHIDDLPYASTTKPFKDRKNNIWIVTNYGHAVFDREQKRFHTFDYTRDSTTTFLVARPFCECPNGEVWFSGDKAGIALVSSTAPSKGVLKKKKIKNDEGKIITVYKLACSRQNDLWGLDHENIFKIDKTTWTAHQFSLDYGVNRLGDVFQFLKNGKLLIGAWDGFYTVDPGQLYRNEILPRPYVTCIRTNKGSKNRIENHLSRIPVRIAAHENVMTIEFSAINHSFAEKTEFQYQLEGLDEDWIDADKKRSLNYSYMPGGDYVFKLRASNNEGVWNEEVYALPIYVGTPWYKTILFWATVFTLLCGLIYAYYRQRIRQVQKESQLKSAFEKQKADLEMNALRAQMNPHFIFNCLNSIDAYIIKNDSKKASEYLNQFSRLVRLILQNSTSNYINLQDELEALDLYIRLEQMRFKHSFTYHINLPASLHPENYEIPPMLLQPFVENAIWHGLQHKETPGKLSINIHKEKETLKCTIHDNGIGRAAAAQYKATQKIKRKSMGMNITTQRIDMINRMYETQNSVHIEDLYDRNNCPTGTKVTLYIPL